VPNSHHYTTSITNRGPVGELIMDPFAKVLERMGVKILGKHVRISRFTSVVGLNCTTLLFSYVAHERMPQSPAVPPHPTHTPQPTHTKQTPTGGRRVQQVLPAEGSTLPGSVVTSVTGSGVTESHPADAIVLSAGVTALQRLVTASPVLAAASDLRASAELRCSDVMAVRLWLDRKVPLRFQSNVLSGFDDGSGATLFDLTTLQVRALCIFRHAE